MSILSRKAVCLLTLLLLCGCGNIAISHVPYQAEPVQKKLAVFFDGTANDEGSHTNVAKLHNLVRLQSRVSISTTYIKGVGVDSKVLGMATGWGIGQDVRQAYRYLAENYKREFKDEIYIFGFSRGAYAARILASLVNVAGIPNVSRIGNEKERIKYIAEIYGAFKSDGEKPIAERRKSVRRVLRSPYAPVRIKFMGIWETVEALGWPDYKENVDVPNPRYADQLCNVDKAAHAMAIDDDRANIFTPILLTRSHLIRECRDVNINEVVSEVWFSGAHSDVGGGYKNTQISGVSLNWMIDQIKKADNPENVTDTSYCFANCLLPPGAGVYGDFAGRTHDPEGGLWGLIYKRKNRDLDAYTEDDGKHLGGRLKIHQSVVDRLAMCKVQSHESRWFTKGKFGACATDSGHGFAFNWNDPNCRKAVQVVDQGYRNFGVKNCGKDDGD